MPKFLHINFEERLEIQRALKEHKTFAQIGELIRRDPSTISKEIRSHLIIKETGTKSKPYNPCKKRFECKHISDLCESCSLSSLSFWRSENYCSLCGKCNSVCKDFEEEHCNLLDHPPYVCNGCSKLRSCTLTKKIYDAKEAQKEYEEVRSESRKGINIDPDELERIDSIITPLIKRGQSIHHICVNNASEIMLDERTIYNYIDLGVLSVCNGDLPRKVRYKKRKVKKEVRIDKKCHSGRTYEDYLEYIKKNPSINVVEMDSVEGSRDSSKVLLTLNFCNCNFMLAFLRPANTAKSVTDIFDYLDKTLGRDTFSKLFQVILTDRGSEFTNPYAIECDENGEIRTRVFYCDPQRPDQKGGIEVGHEFIRRVLPKKVSFEFLTQEKVDLMMSHINSYKREKLNNRSPHQLFSFIYGTDVAESLHSVCIDANEINLKPELLK